MRSRRLLAIACAAIVGAALVTGASATFAANGKAATGSWTGTWSASPESEIGRAHV